MVNVGSLPTAGQTLFMLDTQTGVADLLAAIRASDINSAQKNDLRDLVFLYINGGKDQSIRLSLEQKISAYDLKPAPKKEPAHKPLPPRPTIGTFRAAPSFSVPPVSTPPKPEVKFTESPAWKPTPVVEENIAPEPAPVMATPAPVLQEVPVQPTPVVASPVSTPDQQQFLERIREIKSAVNEKVGNPVNLVDIDNEVGREYMGALLDAMKKLNSGSSAVSAMKRLEEAYVSVENTLQTHSVTANTVAPPQPIPVPVAQVPEVQFQTPVYQAPYVPPTPITTSVPVQAVPRVLPVSQPVQTTPVESQVYTPPAPVSQIARMQAEVPRAPITSQFSSLADLAEKPHTPYDLPTSATPSTATVGDPLYTPEVEEGLNQLMSEWSIFKKSGIFGTGPKGKEHPLFKKMATLQIPLLLAGRFDGATQEIKQSVTDYMNGWRYEQGLIYEKGETFEHYLRRVIRHILDLQRRG
jgi:hypothetical protein